MRKSTSVAAPTFVITLYYTVCVGSFILLSNLVPEIQPHLPLGGIEELLDRGSSPFDRAEIFSSTLVSHPPTSRLVLAMFASLALMAPISWVYFITTRDNQIDRSLAQTMIILPIIVAGIAMIVQNSLALAFSLAGIVAAVRFRFSLSEPAHTLYVFAAITIGLGAGIAAIDVSATVSIAFVYTSLLLWRLDYGKNLNSPFFSFLTGRDHSDDDL